MNFIGCFMFVLLFFTALCCILILKLKCYTLYWLARLLRRPRLLLRLSQTTVRIFLWVAGWMKCRQGITTIFTTLVSMSLLPHTLSCFVLFIIAGYPLCCIPAFDEFHHFLFVLSSRFCLWVILLLLISFFSVLNSFSGLLFHFCFFFFL